MDRKGFFKTLGFLGMGIVVSKIIPEIEDKPIKEFVPVMDNGKINWIEKGIENQEWLDINDYDSFTEECECKHDWILKADGESDYILDVLYLYYLCSKCGAFQMKRVTNEEEFITWNRVKIERLKRLRVFNKNETLESLSNGFMENVINRS